MLNYVEVEELNNPSRRSSNPKWSSLNAYLYKQQEIDLASFIFIY